MATRRLIGTVTLVLALVTGTSAAAAATADAEGTIRSAGSAEVVEDSYVVVLRSATGVPAAVAELRREYGGKIGHTYQHALGGFEVRMDAAAARRLAADPRVSFVQQNGILTASATQSPVTWGLDRIDQRALPLNSSYGYESTASNVHAYVIDTGIRLTHGEFGGRASSGTDTVDGDSDASDCAGHGTHVAGTLGGSTYGVAKAVQLVAVRVLNCAGSGTTDGVIAGVDWVTANAVLPAVANMSLGGGGDAALDAAVSRSIAAGITYAVASGNSAANACSYSPARVTAALTVNNSTSSDARAGTSNFGSCTDLFAPGSSVTSAWYTGDGATSTISGTSMASPHVAGAAALVLAGHPEYTPAEVAAALTGSATSGVITGAGSGSPNRLLHTGTAPDVQPTTPAPAPGCTGSSTADVAVPDAGAAVTSPITVVDCPRAPGSAATVGVQVVHSYRGDLVIDLLAPDGTAYRLKNASVSDAAGDVRATWTVDLSGESAEGTWRLRVQDVYSQDSGYLDGWTLTL